MGSIIKTLRGVTRAIFGLGLVAAWLSSTALRAQQVPVGLGQATDFSSVEYFDAPNELQIKTRLSGAESHPVPGLQGQLEVRALKIENFGTNGQLEAAITAPECIYSTTDFTAHSAGPIRVESGDGKSTLTGDGFLWRQNEKWLTISNHVVTVISETAVPAVK